MISGRTSLTPAECQKERPPVADRLKVLIRLRLFAIFNSGSKNSFAVGVLLAGVAMILNKGIGLITLAYAARVMGPENYGWFGFGTSVTAYASIMLSPGLMTWGTRAIAWDPRRVSPILVIVNLLQTVLAMGAFAGLAAFAYIAVGSPSGRNMLLLCGLGLFTLALSVDWVFYGLHQSLLGALVNAGGALITLIAMLLLMRSSANALLYPLILFLGSLPAIGAGYLVLFKLGSVHLTWPGLRAFRQALCESLPLGVTVALVPIVAQANVLILKLYVGAKALGLFMAPFRTIEITSALPGLIAILYRSRLARLSVESPESAGQEAQRFGLAHMVVAFFLAAFLACEARAVLYLLFGSQYVAAAGLLRVLALGVISNYALFGYTILLISYGRDKVMMGVLLVSAVVSIGGGLIFVPSFGAIGAAAVIVSVNLVAWLVSLPYYRQTIGSFQLLAWRKPILGAILLVVAHFILSRLNVPLWARAISSLGTYAIPFLPELSALSRLFSIRELAVGPQTYSHR